MSKSEIAVGVATGAAAGAGAAFGYQAWRRIAERDTVDGRPVELRRVDPKSVSADPEAFQFKSGGDSHGVTDRLKSVEKWNPTAAGKAMVFEKMDGSQVIADGHQRLGLAQRLISKGQEGIKIDAYVMRERDGWTPRDVRAYAAIKNMHESSGQALDMAKVMRERPDLVTKSLPLSDAKVKDAMSLSKLSDAAFRMVVGGVVKPEHAVAVGEAVGDTSRHEGMIKEMAKADIGSAQHARLYVGQAMAAPTITEHTASLFGEETNTRSLLKERAAVLDKALVALKSDKRIFGLLEREAGNIESVGNKLSHEANAAKAEGAGRTAALIEKLATTRGVVSDMIDQAARAVADGKKPAAAARAFVKQVGDTLKSGGIQALMADGPRTQEMFGSRKWQSVVTKEDIQAAKEKLRGTTPEAKEKWGKILDSVPVDAKQAAKRRDGMEKASGKANPIRVQRMEEGKKIVGHDWEAIQRAQSGGKLNRMIDTSKPSKSPPSAEDMRLLEQHGSVKALSDAGLHGVADRVKDVANQRQSSMFGEATMADKIAAANRAIDAKGRTGDAMNEGLFGSGKLQADLVDMAKQAKAGDALRELSKSDHLSDSPSDKAIVRKAIDQLSEIALQTKSREVADRVSALNRMSKTMDEHGRVWMGGLDRSWLKAAADSLDAHPKGPAGWSDAARDASAEARKADPNAAERARIADGTKRIGDTYKAPAPAAPTAADKFTSGMKPMAAARAKAALETQVRHNRNEFLSRAALVEREIANGATVQTMKIAGKDQRVLMGKDGAFLDTRNITKSGLDYAEHLSAMKPSNPNYTPGVGTKQESYWTHKAPPTPTVNELPEGAFKGTQRDFESLSPGMRREIARTAEKADAPVTVEKAEKFKGTPIPPQPNATSEAERAGRINRLQNRAGAGGLSGKEAEAFVASNLAKLEALDAKRAAPVVQASEPAILRQARENPNDAHNLDQRKLASAMDRERTTTRLKAFEERSERAKKGAATRAANKEKAGSGLRGTQNEANRNAIIKNRKANAKPAEPLKLDPMKLGQARLDTAKAQAAIAKSTGSKAFAAAGLHNAAEADKQWNAAEKASAKPAEKAAKTAATPTKGAGRKAMGLLAPVAIGAAAMVAANQSAKAGESKVQQLQAAGTEAGKGVAVMGGFAAGTAVVAKGLMKAGLTAAKAIPAVGAVLMAGGAIHGAVTAKSGERLKGAAKGAWDMSLPGMVVNTGMAVKEAATSTADRAPINGRLAGDQQAKFAEANAKFMAANSAAAKTESVDKNRGWSNSARIAAYQAKAEKHGFEPKNAPYGGKQSDGPSQWVTSSDPGAVTAAMKKR